MPNTLAQKLKIKEGYCLLALHAPKDFKDLLGAMPNKVQVVEKGKSYQQIHWFVKDKASLEAELQKVLGLLKDDVICWIYYPKGSSKMQTDMTRDKGWEALLRHNHLQWISLISFNETWSAFGMRLKTAANEKRKEKVVERPIFQYINAAEKTIRLPTDFETALAKHQKEVAFFNTLSFTNKKEYVEWIVNAKRQETRLQRVTASVERLGKGWKNPANR